MTAIKYRAVTLDAPKDPKPAYTAEEYKAAARMLLPKEKDLDGMSRYTVPQFGAVHPLTTCQGSYVDVCLWVSDDDVKATK